MLYFVKRPAPMPTAWDSQRRALVHEYTRFGPMQVSRDAAVKRAARVQGRAYEFDGEQRLIFDAKAPDVLREERQRQIRQARRIAAAGPWLGERARA